jgi:hypothetical protein
MNSLKFYNLLLLVAQLFETTCYKPESRGFDSNLSLEFFVEIILPAAIRSRSRLSF